MDFFEKARILGASEGKEFERHTEGMSKREKDEWWRWIIFADPTRKMRDILVEKRSQKVLQGWDDLHEELKEREKLKKENEKAKKTVVEKLAKGWLKVHEDIKSMPFCELQDQVTKVFHCLKCNSCEITGKCVACFYRGVIHGLLTEERTWLLEISSVVPWY